MVRKRTNHEDDPLQPVRARVRERGVDNEDGQEEAHALERVEEHEKGFSHAPGDDGHERNDLSERRCQGPGARAKEGRSTYSERNLDGRADGYAQREVEFV